MNRQTDDRGEKRRDCGRCFVPCLKHYFAWRNVDIYM
jgi:hypothetical protein